LVALPSKSVGTPSDLIPVAFSALCGICGWYGVRSWRRLWRAGRTTAECLVYDNGVRGWGVCVFLSMPLLVLYVLAGVGALSTRLFVACVIVVAPVALPMCLWGGYLFGTLLSGASSMDAPNDDDDLPPHLTGVRMFIVSRFIAASPPMQLPNRTPVGGRSPAPTGTADSLIRQASLCRVLQVC
jgi:hypothetical protein